jgi:hypothetical protein
MVANIRPYTRGLLPAGALDAHPIKTNEAKEERTRRFQNIQDQAWGLDPE